MNGLTAAVVIFFLLMCMKRLLLSLTPLLQYDTHKHLNLNLNTHCLYWLHGPRREKLVSKTKNKYSYAA